MSCGIDKDRNYGRTPATLGQQIAIEAGELSEQEQAIAVRICFAYRSKRGRFSTTLIGEDFSFNITHNKCDGSAINENIDAKLAQNNLGLFYSSSYSGEFYSKVETDIDGILTKVCESVLRGDNSQNTFIVNNSTHAITFSSLGNIDSYEVQIAQKSLPNTKEVITQIMNFEVLEKSSTNPYYGATTKVRRIIACNSSENPYDILTKTLLSN